MKVILDNIIFSLQQSGGISAYWFEIVSRALNDNKFDTQIIESKKLNRNIFHDKLTLNDVNIIYKNTNIIDRVLPVHFKESSNSVFHSSYYRYTKNKHSKVITTVHDFIQETVYSSKNNLHTLMKARAIINSDLLIAISENTKADILKFFPKVDSNKIKVIYNGVSNDYFPLENHVKKNKSLNSVLFVGSRASYKNFDFVVEILSKFDDLVLNIVGSKLDKREITLLTSKLPKQRWNSIVNPSNNELNILYNSSGLLLYPSSYEGFGIPVIEAMKAGCPVVGLNSSSIPEISGNAALLLDKLSIDDFYFGIKEIFLSRNKYVQLGLENAKRFSWEKTYLETVNLYNF